MSAKTKAAVRILALVALLGGAAYLAFSQGLLPWKPAAAGPLVSEWIEREKSLFREVLSKGRFDLLVLPVAVEEPGFDRTARSLMTRYLARRATERTGIRLPDPTLLARALGSRERRVDISEAQRLADALGAKSLIASTARRGAGSFEFSSTLWTREGNGAWREAGSAIIKDLKFADALPPSASFRDNADAVLAQLKIGKDVPAAPAVAAESVAVSIADLRKLAATASGTRLEHALRLQLFAALHERGSIEGESLWERSLVALWGEPDTADARLLEARAYLNLERRPYALQKLGEPTGAAERALLAEMNGDAPGLEAILPQVEHPVQRLMSEIALADLYVRYGQDERGKKVRARVLEKPATQAAVLSFRLPSTAWFSPEVPRQAWLEMERIAPSTPDWIERAIEHAPAWAVVVYHLVDALTDPGFRLARMVEKRCAPFWRIAAADWGSARAADRLAPWDYVDLLCAQNRSAIVGAFHTMVARQDLPAQAASTIEALHRTYAGHPWLTYYHAVALDFAGRKLEPGETQQEVFLRSSALALAVYGWEQGESPASVAAEELIFERKYRKYDDEPPRWYRGEMPSARAYFDKVRYTREEAQARADEARRRLAYSDRNAAPLRDLVRWLKRAGDQAGAIAVIKENQHRFAGSKDLPDLAAEFERTAAGHEELLATYRARLDADPDSWESRRNLARALAETDNHRDAQRVLLDSPRFSDSDSAEPVLISNLAFEGGFFVYRLGEAALAEPLLLRAARLDTGAASQMRSVEILLLMQNRMGQSLDLVRHQVERYNDVPAAAREVVYMYLLGQRKEALEKLGVYVNKFEDPEIWAAALILQRLEGAEAAEVEAWLALAAAGDKKQNYLSKSLRERHAFMMALVDRNASPASVEHLRKVASANNRSPYYPQIAQGYIALRGGDFVSAAQHLQGPYRDLFNISVSRREHLVDLLPYLAWAYLRAGKDADARKLVEDYGNAVGLDSDYLVARALLEGAAGNHDEAIILLNRAALRLPPISTRSFPPSYVLLESCEFLFKQTGNALYRRQIQKLSRRMHLILPFPWAVTFAAMYAEEGDDYRVAMGAATIVDAKSPRVSHVPDGERNAMRASAARHDSVLGVSLRKR